jgi:CheY-like chemotaxis protein
MMSSEMASAQFMRRFSRDVLLVEDDVDFREGLADILRSEGYTVTCAANGLEALEYLRRADTAPKVILLDLAMPVMDGWGFRQRMLAESSIADIPVILLSGARDFPASNLQALGALTKPVDLSRLLQMIEGHLLDTCALCRGPVRESSRTVVVKGAIAATLCQACEPVGSALETELAATLERFAADRKHAVS